MAQDHNLDRLVTLVLEQNQNADASLTPSFVQQCRQLLQKSVVTKDKKVLPFLNRLILICGQNRELYASDCVQREVCGVIQLVCTFDLNDPAVEALVKSICLLMRAATAAQPRNIMEIEKCVEQLFQVYWNCPNQELKSHLKDSLAQVFRAQRAILNSMLVAAKEEQRLERLKILKEIHSMI